MAEEFYYRIEEPKNKCCQHWVNNIARNNPTGHPEGIKYLTCGSWHEAELKAKAAKAA